MPITLAPRADCCRNQEIFAAAVQKDGRIVIGLHRRHDHDVGPLRVAAREGVEVERPVDLQGGKERHRAGARRHDLHLGHVGTLEHRMGQQQVGHLGALVQGQHRDHRPAARLGPQRLDECRWRLRGRRCGVRGARQHGEGCN